MVRLSVVSGALGRWEEVHLVATDNARPQPAAEAAPARDPEQSRDAEQSESAQPDSVPDRIRPEIQVALRNGHYALAVAILAAVAALVGILAAQRALWEAPDSLGATLDYAHNHDTVTDADWPRVAAAGAAAIDRFVGDTAVDKFVAHARKDVGSG